MAETYRAGCLRCIISALLMPQNKTQIAQPAALTSCSEEEESTRWHTRRSGAGESGEGTLEWLGMQGQGEFSFIGVRV